MAKKIIDAKLFKKMIINGAVNLKNHQAEVDKLNVFPVPDGDTGTNMSMTMMSGVAEINALNSDVLVEITKSLSRGLLMGARGNSGVILSQFFRGLHLEVKANGFLKFTVDNMIDCLVNSYKVAYKSVMQPVEGTVLTVTREAGEFAYENRESFEDMESLFAAYNKEARASLVRTPDLLPVLKEAGVVDSGATGFVYVLEGMELALNGKMLESKENQTDSSSDNKVAGDAEVDIKFTYCTEFIIKLKDKNCFEESDLRSPYSLMGDSLVLVVDDDLCKVHVHSNRPGRVLEIAQRFGDFVKLKIENMRLQHNELLDAKDVPVNAETTEEVQLENQEPKEYGIVVVCFGSGIKSTFEELGADYVIDGGQTMNPPTEQFVKAINYVNAKNVIIIPNNGNVILAAEQAAKFVADRQEVRIIKAKTVPQGYGAIMNFDSNNDIDTNFEEMTEAMKEVGSGEVTYAVRDTEINGVNIKIGDFMGIANGKIINSSKNRVDAATAILDKLVNEDTAIVTIFKGLDSDDTEVKTISAYAEELNEDLEVEVIDGNQDIYSYILAVE